MEKTSVRSANSSAKISQLVKTFRWAGSSPSGSWVDPAAVDYQALGDTYDLARVGAYTLNSQIEQLSGEQHVQRLGAIFFDEIVGSSNYNTLLQWTLKQGYAPADLRTAECICRDDQFARSLNPDLFNDIEAYLNESNCMSASLIFPGSTICSDVGRINFPYLFWSGITKRLGKGRGGYHVSNSPCKGNVFFYVKI